MLNKEIIMRELKDIYNNILEDINNYSVIIEKDRLQDFYDWIYDNYSVDFEMLQINLERVFKNTYYSDILKITDILDDDYDEIEKLAMETENLIKQRDLLLPRLMSGKLAV